MDFSFFSTAAIFLILGTSLILLISRDWRIVVSALGIQYFGVFMLVALTWPLEMAVIKLVVGWISAAVLGMELVSLSTEHTGKEILGRSYGLSGFLFRIFLAVLIDLTIFSLVTDMASWVINAAYPQLLGSMFLVGLGLLILGLTNRPFGVTVGILTFLSGFEILYAALDTSTLIAGFFAVLSLGIALVGSYLLATPTLEVDS